MRLSEAFVLLTAGTLGGLLSTVVSIASLVSYPVLLALGVPPLTANMTNTVSLVLTGPGSVASSRPELNGQGARVIRLTAVTALGGVTGAAVLLLAPASSFTAVAPVLIGGASVVLFVQPRMTALVPRPDTADAADAADPAHGAGGLAHLVALFLVAVYVGYFGAAAGVLLLAVLSS